jgi:Gpi18-like mannosyltransferase
MTDKIQDWRKYENHLILVGGTVLALLLRFTLREFQSGDYKTFGSQWYDFIVQHGGFRALAYNFSNYNPPYLYLMALVIWLFPWLPKIVAIKLISVVFDLICAAFVYKLVRLKYPAGLTPVFSFLAVLFAPTVFLNSSMWGQADVIYTTGLVACLYYLCRHRPGLALVVFGLAFAFKMQAMFLAPFLLALLVKKEVAWKSVFIVPLVYLLSLVPAWLAGRPFLDLLLIYVSQSTQYRSLSKNAPSFYVWFPNSAYDFLYPAGLILAVVVALVLVMGVYKSQVKVDRELMVQLALLSVLSMPYFLPKMHERFFFAADILSIVYGFYFPTYFFIPIAVIASSFFAYFPYLFKIRMPLSVFSVALATVIIILSHHLVGVLKHSSPATVPPETAPVPGRPGG